MNELIAQLTKSLNVNTAQAEGGAGAIFKLAQEKLGGDFSKISSLIPGIEQMMQSAPEASTSPLSGLMGAAASMLGTQTNAGGLMALAGVFQKLNIDTATAMKFAPVILEFVQSKGGDTCKQMLQKALGA